MPSPPPFSAAPKPSPDPFDKAPSPLPKLSIPVPIPCSVLRKKSPRPEGPPSKSNNNPISLFSNPVVTSLRYCLAAKFSNPCCSIMSIIPIAILCFSDTEYRSLLNRPVGSCCASFSLKLTDSTTVRVLILERMCFSNSSCANLSLSVV
ncbi:hypothetical protein EGW08_021969 [Elysia chlorotica]|uniref:Uncharacterized protein n=1 Tax=Elysia chlorotica TaxID=188477 RepID=A0A3S1ARU7_ELYCH|nr:hypothetical protein EGW08_021969 [Elysia chlorotica]